MSKNEILKTIQHLALSQGFYCRLLKEIEQDNSLLDVLEDNHFNNTVEMILWIEG